MFSAIYFFAAGFAVWSKYYKFALYKFAKPVPLFLLSTIYLFTPNFSPAFETFLALSFVGDLLLLGESRKFFAAGLISFLGAHLALIFGLLARQEGNFSAFAALVIAIVSFSYYAIALKNNAGEMKLPVVVYLAVISVMLFVASAFANVAPAVFSGAILFYVSDALLAYGKFVRKFRIIDLLSLSAYYTGEYLIFSGFVSLN